MASIIDARTLAAGNYQYPWPADDIQDGVYFAVLKVNDVSRAIKVVKL